MEAIVITVPVRAVLTMQDAKALFHELGAQLLRAEAAEAVAADA